MAVIMDSLHRTIPALERSHKQLQETLKEALKKMQKEKVYMKYCVAMARNCTIKLIEAIELSHWCSYSRTSGNEHTLNEHV